MKLVRLDPLPETDTSGLDRTIAHFDTARRADVPGIHKEDIDLQIEDGVLTLHEQRPHLVLEMTAKPKRVEIDPA